MTKHEVENEVGCSDCSHYRHREGFRGSNDGHCSNHESEHFGHIVMRWHPACEEIHNR